MQQGEIKLQRDLVFSKLGNFDVFCKLLGVESVIWLMKGWCGHSVFVVERYGSSWKTGCGVSFFFKWATFITPLCSAARSSVGRALAGHFSRYAGFFTCFWGLLGFLHRVRLSAVIRGSWRQKELSADSIIIVSLEEKVIRGFAYGIIRGYPRQGSTCDFVGNSLSDRVGKR